MSHKKKIAIVAIVVVGGVGAWQFSQPSLTDFKRTGPDEIYPKTSLTPGAVNPDITQANINKTICAHGKWSTKSIRPPVSYTNKLKLEQIKEYGYSDTNPKDYEEDHLIALTIGGNPTDAKNLWPEPYNTEINGHIVGAKQKDRLEVTLNGLVCNGKLTLQEAQKKITEDWLAASNEYVGVGKLGALGGGEGDNEPIENK